MAGQRSRRQPMTGKKKPAPRAALIAVDGVEPGQVLAEARAALGSRDRGGISRWDASGVFQELAVADQAAGAPSARTLLLLYAADLAFRLRWEIRPALDRGLVVAAAPYVATAVAFGRVAGLPAAWLKDLFRFAPRPSHACYVDGSAAKSGFIGFSCSRLPQAANDQVPKEFVDRVRTHLRPAGRGPQRRS